MKKGINDISCDSCTENCLNPVYMNKVGQSNLSDQRRFITYKKGETIYKQATYISHIVFVRSGLVKIFTEGKNGKNIILRVIQEGEYIGLPFLYNDNYAFFSATAIKETNLCMIEKNLFSELVSNNEELRSKIVNLISKDIGILYEKMTTLGTKQLHGRLATAILELSDNKKHEDNLYAVLTKKELAEFSGMSPESLMRLLNEFKADKIIISEGKKIIINDYEMLVKLSQIG